MNIRTTTMMLILSLCALRAGATDEIKLPPKPLATATASAQADSSSTSQATSDLSASQSIEVNDRLQAPAIAAPSVFPTATCQSGISIGGSGQGGGGLLGFSFSKKECELFLLAQNYAMLGMTVAACETLNKTKAAKRAYGDALPACLPRAAPYHQPPPTPEPKPVVVVLQGDGCGERHDEKLKRVLEHCVAK